MDGDHPSRSTIICDQAHSEYISPESYLYVVIMAAELVKQNKVGVIGGSSGHE